MAPVKADFLLVKTEESAFDVVIFADKPVLKAFQEVYGAFYCEESIFQNKPVAIVSDFEKQEHAEAWKQYWILAFSEPENACQSCVTVNKLFRIIGEERNMNSDSANESDSRKN